MIGSRWVAPFLLFLGLAAHARAQDVTAPDAATSPPARDGWVAARMLSPGETVRAEDVSIKPLTSNPYGLFDIDHSPIGMDVKHRILSGRPLLERDVGRHALVRANTPVHVLWRSDTISMDLQGRALQDGAVGDPVRVVNPSTARTLQGVVMPDGTVQVGG